MKRTVKRSAPRRKVTRKNPPLKYFMLHIWPNKAVVKTESPLTMTRLFQTSREALKWAEEETDNHQGYAHLYHDTKLIAKIRSTKRNPIFGRGGAKEKYVLGEGWHSPQGKIYQEERLIPDTPLPVGWTTYGVPAPQEVVETGKGTEGFWVMSGHGRHHKYPFKTSAAAEDYADYIKEAQKTGSLEVGRERLNPRHGRDKEEFITGIGWRHSDGSRVYQEEHLIPESSVSAGLPIGWTDYGVPLPDEEVFVNSDSQGHWVMSGHGSHHKYPFRELANAEKYAEHVREQQQKTHSRVGSLEKQGRENPLPIAEQLKLSGSAVPKFIEMMNVGSPSEPLHGTSGGRRYVAFMKRGDWYFKRPEDPDDKWILADDALYEELSWAYHFGKLNWPTPSHVNPSYYITTPLFRVAQGQHLPEWAAIEKDNVFYNLKDAFAAAGAYESQLPHEVKGKTAVFGDFDPAGRRRYVVHLGYPSWLKRLAAEGIHLREDETRHTTDDRTTAGLSNPRTDAAQQHWVAKAYRKGKLVSKGLNCLIGTRSQAEELAQQYFAEDFVEDPDRAPYDKITLQLEREATEDPERHSHFCLPWPSTENPAGGRSVNFSGNPARREQLLMAQKVAQQDAATYKGKYPPSTTAIEQGFRQMLKKHAYYLADVETDKINAKDRATYRQVYFQEFRNAAHPPGQEGRRTSPAMDKVEIDLQGNPASPIVTEIVKQLWALGFSRRLIGYVQMDENTLKVNLGMNGAIIRYNEGTDLYDITEYHGMKKEETIEGVYAENLGDVVRPMLHVKELPRTREEWEPTVEEGETLLKSEEMEENPRGSRGDYMYYPKDYSVLAQDYIDRVSKLHKGESLQIGGDGDKLLVAKKVSKGNWIFRLKVEPVEYRTSRARWASVKYQIAEEIDYFLKYGDLHPADPRSMNPVSVPGATGPGSEPWYMYEIKFKKPRSSHVFRLQRYAPSLEQAREDFIDILEREYAYGWTGATREKIEAAMAVTQLTPEQEDIVRQGWGEVIENPIDPSLQFRGDMRWDLKNLQRILPVGTPVIWKGFYGDPDKTGVVIGHDPDPKTSSQTPYQGSVHVRLASGSEAFIEPEELRIARRGNPECASGLFRVSADEVSDFKDGYPVSGLPNDMDFYFEFDRRGDLVDAWAQSEGEPLYSYGSIAHRTSTEQWDGPALVALSGDAQTGVRGEKINPSNPQSVTSIPVRDAFFERMKPYAKYGAEYPSMQEAVKVVRSLGDEARLFMVVYVRGRAIIVHSGDFYRERQKEQRGEKSNPEDPSARQWRPEDRGGRGEFWYVGLYSMADDTRLSGQNDSFVYRSEALEYANKLNKANRHPLYGTGIGDPDRDVVRAQREAARRTGNPGRKTIPTPPEIHPPFSPARVRDFGLELVHELGGKPRNYLHEVGVRDTDDDAIQYLQHADYHRSHGWRDKSGVQWWVYQKEYPLSVATWAEQGEQSHLDERSGNPVETEELGEDYTVTEEEFVPPVEEFPAPAEEPVAAPVDPAEVSESYREHLDLVTSPEFQEAPPEEKAAMLTVADAVEKAVDKAEALGEEIPESANPKLYRYDDIKELQKKWESKPLGQRDFRGPYVTKIPYAKSYPYSALIFGPDFTQSIGPYAVFAEAYRRGQEMMQEAKQRTQNPHAPRYNPDSDYLPPIIHIWRGWTHKEGNFWTFTIESRVPSSGRGWSGSYDHVTDKQFKTSREAREFALSVIGKPDYDAPRWKEAKVKIHQTYWSPAGYEQDPPRDEPGAEENPSQADSDLGNLGSPEWPWAYQYIDTEKTEEDARQALEFQKMQDGFIGGRIYYREDDKIWYVQAISQDEGEPDRFGQDWFPEGVRRVKIPPNFWSKLEDATGEKLTKDRGIALAKKGGSR